MTAVPSAASLGSADLLRARPSQALWTQARRARSNNDKTKTLRCFVCGCPSCSHMGGLLFSWERAWATGRTRTVCWHRWWHTRFREWLLAHAHKARFQIDIGNATRYTDTSCVTTMNIPLCGLAMTRVVGGPLAQRVRGVTHMTFTQRDSQ